eukprot:5618700-Alexandrium_andersonii.AAC.1
MALGRAASGAPRAPAWRLFPPSVLPGLTRASRAKAVPVRLCSRPGLQRPLPTGRGPGPSSCPGRG